MQERTLVRTAVWLFGTIRFQNEIDIVAISDSRRKCPYKCIILGEYPDIVKKAVKGVGIDVETTPRKGLVDAAAHSQGCSCTFHWRQTIYQAILP